MGYDLQLEQKWRNIHYEFISISVNWFLFPNEKCSRGRNMGSRFDVENSIGCLNIPLKDFLKG